jgi:Clp amino terminal domain, pathogenicity island component
VGWTPLCGKALAAKGALHLAAVEADALGEHEVGPEQVLLGVLRDAAPLTGDPRPSRRARRTWAYLGLPEQGASPVRRVVEGRGLTLEQLRGAVLAELHAAT